MAQNLGGVGLLEETALQFGGAFAKRRQLDRFQSNRLAGLQIVRLVNGAGGRPSQFTQDFEVADLCEHGSVPHPRQKPRSPVENCMG